MAFSNTESIKDHSLVALIARIAAIWFIAQIGYYLFLPTITGSLGYSTSPIQITLYYLFWLGIALYTFWELYSEWHSFERRNLTYAIALLGGIGIVAYLAYILPNFQAIEWTQPWQPPSELLFATQWYFLPKSIDILLQQLLVLALALSFSLHGFSFRSTQAWCAILFGGAHLFLIWGSNSLYYTLAFTASALVASFVFPYFLLKVKNGFLYSYLIHWLFYAVVIVVVRAVFAM